MPLFFLLSGICMTLSYGKKTYIGSTICCGKEGKCLDTVVSWQPLHQLHLKNAYIFIALIYLIKSIKFISYLYCYSDSTLIQHSRLIKFTE